MKIDTTAYRFLGLSLICLMTGMVLGILGGLQYIFPAFLKESLSFQSIRPLHTLFVVSWILLAASGIVYFFLPRISKNELAPAGLEKLHFIIFICCGISVALSFLSGKFGGKEYEEFSPWFAIPILSGWVVFAIVFFRTALKVTTAWPVYIWMWGTGIFFFILTFGESFLWIFPWFRDNIVRDITVQWKANGAIVGSWNMLVYGTSIFIMNKINPNSKAVRGGLPFAIFFVGLTNLLFGWGHHIYIVPSAPWVRHVSYLISMTEWILLARMIWYWRKTLIPEPRHVRRISYQFLFSGNSWVLINLFLALLISIPAINYYTHGTHITVAHAMGTTIGINTPLLLAAIFLIFEKSEIINQSRKKIRISFLIFHISLTVFFISLITAGIIRSYHMYSPNALTSYSEMHQSAIPVYFVFLCSGVGILIGLTGICIPLVKEIAFRLRAGTPAED